MRRRSLNVSDARLLEATQAGDAEAFGVFFARHSRGVLRFVRRRVGSAETAVDITAETFAAALLSVHRGHAGEVPDGAAWLVGIARHKIADSCRAGSVQDQARQQLRLERIVPDDGDVRAIDELAGGDAPAHVALEQLGREEREAILERVVLEREYSEIAEHTASSEAAIRKRVSRGLARLRKQLEPETK
jgi:RNA polymerase sigma factor (sigma-70 family)